MQKRDQQWALHVDQLGHASRDHEVGPFRKIQGTSCGPYMRPCRDHEVRPLRQGLVINLTATTWKYILLSQAAG